MRKPETILELECNHLVVDTGKYRVSALCPRCHCLKEIVNRHKGFKAICVDCRYSRNFGAARVTAEHGASRHGRANPTHTIGVFLGTRCVTRIEPRKNLTDLFDQPPY